MGKIAVENNIFIYRESGTEKVLLNCNDLIANKSRIPMHSFDGDLTIPGLILNTMKEHEKLSEGKSGTLDYLLMDILLISYLIKSAVPVKVLELGCTDGLLSYHLATILGKFNPKSLLCSVCDVIGNSSNNRWLDRVSLVNEAPELSLLVADYDSTQLACNNYDIVIINGTVGFREPYVVIKEAENLTKKDGLIFCYANEQPLLESCFRLLFSEREEYTLVPSVSIMTTKCAKNTENRDEDAVWRESVREWFGMVEKVIHHGANREEIRGMIRSLEEYIGEAMGRNDLDMKIKLLYQKEILLDMIGKL